MTTKQALHRFFPNGTGYDTEKADRKRPHGRNTRRSSGRTAHPGIIEQSRLVLEQEKLNLETDRVALEHNKFSYERRWKLYTAIGAVLSAVLSLPVATKLLQPTEAATSQTVAEIGLTHFFSRSNDFLASNEPNHFASLLRSSRREVWFVGTSFFISADTYRKELVQAVQRGVNVHFLILDPESEALSRMANSFDSSSPEIRNQSRAGVQTLAGIAQDVGRISSPTTGTFLVKLASEQFVSRLYFFDPKSTDGATYYIPYMNRMNSQHLPGFLVKNATAKFHEQYFSGVQKLWNSSNTLTLDEWLRRYPDMSS